MHCDIHTDLASGGSAYVLDDQDERRHIGCEQLDVTKCECRAILGEE